jgi:hypothetical protein
MRLREKLQLEQTTFDEIKLHDRHAKGQDTQTLLLSA